MLPSPLLRQQQATLLALLSGVCSKYHFQVRISKLPLVVRTTRAHVRFYYEKKPRPRKNLFYYRAKFTSIFAGQEEVVVIISVSH